MLDMGFQQSLDAIAGHVPLQRQTLLFSATYPDDIAAIANRITRDPITIAVAGSHSETSIRQELYSVSDDAERSEEHTSEVQSRGQLACRLLPEKQIDARRF